MKISFLQLRSLDSLGLLEITKQELLESMVSFKEAINDIEFVLYFHSTKNVLHC